MAMGVGMGAAAFGPFGVEAKDMLAMAMMINHLYCRKEGKIDNYGS